MATPTTDTVAAFLIQTTDGRTYKKGDSNFTPLGAASAELTGYEYQGDFLDLTYTGGLTVSIPEAQIAYVAAVNA